MSPEPVIAFERSYTFSVAPDDLWAVLEDTDGYEAWWPWLRSFEVEGAALSEGSVMHGVVVPPVPYKMSVEVEILAVSRPKRLEAIVRGDLEGQASISLSPDGARGESTRVDVSWSVEMMQRPMRVADRFARPVLRRGHDLVVAVTVAGLRRHLRDLGHETA